MYENSVFKSYKNLYFYMKYFKRVNITIEVTGLTDQAKILLFL